MSTYQIIQGDCLQVLPTMEADSADSVVTDPPYHLTTGKKGGTGPASINLNTPAGRARIGTGFMGKEWDGGDVAFRRETWEAVLRVAKPGAFLLAFGGTRTFHRMMVAVEDAGWELRDTIMWVYGSGFPKSLNLDGKHEGWGTALKPAWEPIIVARKPLVGTVAANVERFGTGALNIDACRVDGIAQAFGNGRGFSPDEDLSGTDRGRWQPTKVGRWPANLIHDGSAEVVAAFPDAPGQMRDTGPQFGRDVARVYGTFAGTVEHAARGDSGSAARFFYCAKASESDREEGNDHPTVKPTELMRYLVRLVTPLGGRVLDPFTGSGSTGRGAVMEGMAFTGIEREAAYAVIAEKRIASAARTDEANCLFFTKGGAA